MKVLPNNNDVGAIDWEKVETVATMVATRNMTRGDLEFGPIEVKIYAAGTVLRIDIQQKSYD